MPLRDDLLNPISEEKPSGESLKYSPLMDKIKEARRQDDDAPQGEWQRERKVADYPLIIKLTSEAIATKSKDLQLAAWLTEALLQREGFAGLLGGLKVLRGLIENFWDTLHPLVEEEEDIELRAAPLSWVGSYLDNPARNTPLTVAGYGFYKYRESRAIPTEEDASYDEAKMATRTAAIEDGKLTPEEWDKAFAASPKEYYVELTETLQGIMDELEALATISEEKFGDYLPSFSKLRTAMEEVHHTAKGLLNKKKEAEPDAAPETTDEATSTSEDWSSGWSTGQPEAATAAAPARAPARKVTSVEPADRDDAINRVIAVAQFLRQQDASDPAPYMLLRGLRWGELRAAGSTLDPSMFEAPPTEIRQSLKRKAMEGNWSEVLETGERAMGMPCGRAWLDLQRYIVRAAEESSYTSIAEAVKSGVRSLLADYPDLSSQTLMDDTPTANPETQNWLKEIAPAAAAASDGWSSAPAPVMEEEVSYSGSKEEAVEAPPDSYELAMQAVRQGRKQEAFEILTQEVGRQTTGRGRFQRKMQLAQLCISMGHENIAYSILDQLAATIDEHKLESWEAPDVVAHALSMLYQCMQKVDADPAAKQKLYTRICRLDPMQALAHAR